MDDLRMDKNSILAAKKLLSKKNERFMNAFLHECASDSLMSEMKPVLLNELKEASLIAMQNSKNLNGGDLESITKEYISRCENRLLPQSNFDWLDKKNIRQCNFVWLYLCKKKLRHYKSLKNIKNDDKKYLEIIGWIDNFPGLAIHKIKLMDEIKIRWECAIAYKNANFDFIDIKNPVQCRKVIEFLQKPIGNRSKQLYNKPKTITGHDISSDYYRFLLSVDWWDVPPDEKAYFHNKIKDASRKWNKSTKRTKERSDRASIKKLKKAGNSVEDSALDFSVKCKQDDLSIYKENNKEKILNVTYENKKLTNDEGSAVIVRRRKLKY